MVGELSNTARFAKYETLSLVTFIPATEGKKNKQMDKALADLSSLLGILSIDRNKFAQIYLQQVLHNSGHLTLPTRPLLHHLQRNLIKAATSSFPKVRFCHIPSSDNYISHDKRFIVLNDDSDLQEIQKMGIDTHSTHTPLKDCQDDIVNLFRDGLYKYFEFNNNKRSTNIREFNSKRPNEDDSVCTASSKRSKRRRYKDSARAAKKKKSTNPELTINKHALPTVTIGYTQNDTNQYSENMSTVAGTIKPCLRNGGMSLRVSRRVISLVETVLKALPSDQCFNLDSISNEFGERDERRKLISELNTYLGGDGDTTYFRVEGIAIVIPLSIGYHKDTLNCDRLGMQSVVSINSMVPIDEFTLPEKHSKHLRQWCKLNGHLKSFPCSVILYSRKCVGSYAYNMSIANRMSGKCLLRKTVFWALRQRIGDLVDYRSTVWNNVDFVLRFSKEAKVRKDGCFRGKYLVRTASYDRLVSLLIYQKFRFVTLVLVDSLLTKNIYCMFERVVTSQLC